jgi:hypothetical protein
MRNFIALILLSLATIMTMGQTVSLVGPTTASAGETKNYYVEFRNEYNQVIQPPQGTYFWSVLFRSAHVSKFIFGLCSMVIIWFAAIRNGDL